MVSEDNLVCPNCGSPLHKYGTTTRYLKSKNGSRTKIAVQRVYCKLCKKYHRVITEDIMPYKQYERAVIEGVQEGLISSDTLGFENYPSEKQMDRWKSQEKHLLL